MRYPVIVYSPDPVRGRIISNILRINGVDTRRFTTHFEVKQAVHSKRTPVVVVDARSTSEDEIAFIRALRHYLPRTAVVIQARPEDAAELEFQELGAQKHLVDPIDPQQILAVVREELSRRGYRLRAVWEVMASGFAWTLRLLVRAVGLTVALLIGATLGYIFWCIATLPDVATLEEYTPYESSKLYSHDNVLLSEFYVERRTFIASDKIPQHVKDALIAVEDARFYKHYGIDPIRIAQAVFTDIREQAFMQGASTITQQLAKMIFLTPEKTITRKLQEIFLSLQLERRYSKDEILGLYFNQAYFGTRAYGIEAAAQTYFSKSTEALELPEAALLAALPKAPSSYSPFKNPERARERRNLVLNRMLENGLIDESRCRQAMQAPIPDRFFGRKFKAPYFVDYCRGELEKRYGDRLYTAGLVIYSTLDLDMQRLAEQAVAGGVAQLEERGCEGVQAALIAVELATGRILAMVGGTDFWQSQFNRATQAMRQPGSAFKPIVYLTALDQGYGLNDVIKDLRFTYSMGPGLGSWSPRNYSNKYRGAVTLKTALAHSMNAATVNLARKIGIKNVVRTARQLGIRSTIHPWLSSALGASEVTLIELVYAYAALAHGKRMEPISFDRVIDKEELILLEPSGVQERVVPRMSLASIRYMLRHVVLEGTGRKARKLERKVYGKTGTTNEHADALFVGFDDNLVVGVWVGRDDRTPIGEGETGASAALPIWLDFMQRATP